MVPAPPKRSYRLSLITLSAFHSRRMRAVPPSCRLCVNLIVKHSNRQVRAFGFECCVVTYSLIPVRARERVKTDRLDAIRLARFLRAGELTPI